jgi:hypothetical protein
VEHTHKIVEVLKLHWPKIVKSGEAKKSWTRIMKGAAEQNQVYVVMGTNNRSVVVMGLNQFEEVRNSYTELAEKWEAKRVLEEEGTNEALERVSEEDLPQDRDDFVTASKLEKRQLTERR